jgi:hypothetical protein
VRPAPLSCPGTLHAGGGKVKLPFLLAHFCFAKSELTEKIETCRERVGAEGRWLRGARGCGDVRELMLGNDFVGFTPCRGRALLGGWRIAVSGRKALKFLGAAVRATG